MKNIIKRVQALLKAPALCIHELYRDFLPKKNKNFVLQAFRSILHKNTLII